MTETWRWIVGEHREYYRGWQERHCSCSFGSSEHRDCRSDTVLEDKNKPTKCTN